MDSGKNRRSSILKPQKARNPLSDLDFTETVEDISPVVSGRPSMRRVSFASSNFVKEFATDPEKNTIWDSTYEEMVNSDSTQSSENAHNTLGMQHTQCAESMQITNENIQCLTINSNDDDSKQVVISKDVSQACLVRAEIGHTTTYTTQTVQVTKEITSTSVDLTRQLNRRKTSINFNNQGGEDIVTDSSLSDLDRSLYLVLEKENMQPVMPVKNTDTRNLRIEREKQTRMEENTNNEFVQQVPANHKVKNKPQISPAESTNSLGAIRKIRGGVSYPAINEMHGAFSFDKENVIQGKFHGVASHLGEAKYDNLLVELEVSQNKENVNILSKDIAFIPNKRNLPNIKNDNKDLTSSVTFSNQPGCKNMKNVTVIDEGNMEFTRPLTEMNSSNYRVDKNQTLMSENNMEITRQISSAETTSELTGNKTIMSDDNMELTRDVITFNKTNYTENRTFWNSDDMEFTRQDATMSRTRREIGGNKSVISDVNMEFTQIGSCLNIADSAVTRNKTILDNDSVEFTQLAALNKTSSEIMGNTLEASDIEMEFTELAPILNKANSEGSRNKTFVDNSNMEFTQQLASLNKTKSETVGNVLEVEFTKFVPALNTANYEVTKNKTIVDNDNMEFTPPLATLSKTSSAIVGNNFEVSDVDMEFTELAPLLNNVNSEVTENKTIKNDNIEFTQHIATLSKTSPASVGNKLEMGNINKDSTQLEAAVGKGNIEDVGSKTLINDSIMEFAEDLAAANEQKYEEVKNKSDNCKFSEQLVLLHQTNSEVQKNETLVLDANNMKFVQPEVNFENLEKVESINDNHNKFPQSAMCKESYEIGVNESLLSDNMEFTNEMASLNKTSSDILGNKMEKDVICMEIIQTETTLNKTQSGATGNSIHTNNDNMESTQQVSALRKTSNESVCNETGKSDVNMEFVLLESAYSTVNCEVMRKRISRDNDAIEFSNHTLNNTNFENVNMKIIKPEAVDVEGKTTTNDDNFLPGSNKENHEIIENKIIPSYNMKFAHRITESDIVYNETLINDASMEFPLPALNKKRTEIEENGALQGHNMELTQRMVSLNETAPETMRDKIEMSSGNFEYNQPESSANKANSKIMDSVIIVNDSSIELATSKKENSEIWKNKTIFSESQVFTHQVVAFNKTSSEIKRNNTEESDANMEYPHLESAVTKANSEVMGKSINISDDKMQLSQHSLSKQNNDFQKNKTSPGINLNFAQQVHSLKKESEMVGNVIEFNDSDMKFAQPESVLNKTDSETVDDNMTNNSGIAFTKHLTAANKECNDIVKKQSVIADTNMEFTELMPDLSKANSEDTKYKAIISNETMNFTQHPIAVGKESHPITESKRVSNIMNFPHQATPLNKASVELMKNKTLVNSANIEPILNKGNSEVMRNKAIINNVDVEPTEHLPTLSSKKSLKITGNKIEMYDINMKYNYLESTVSRSISDVIETRITESINVTDVAQQENVLNKTSSESSKNKALVDEVKVEVAQLEPPWSKTVVKDDNMEFAQQLVVLRTEYDIEKNEASAKIVRNDTLKNARIDAAQSEPRLSKPNYEVFKNKAVIKDDKVEFAQQLAASKKECNNNGKNKTSDDNTESTQQKAVLNKTSLEISRNKTLESDTMKVTQSELHLSKIDGDTSKNKTDDDIEFAEQLAVLKKECNKTGKDETTLDEFTPKRKVLSKRSSSIAKNNTSMECNQNLADFNNGIGKNKIILTDHVKSTEQMAASNKIGSDEDPITTNNISMKFNEGTTLHKVNNLQKTDYENVTSPSNAEKFIQQLSIFDKNALQNLQKKSRNQENSSNNFMAFTHHINKGNYDAIRNVSKDDMNMDISLQSPTKGTHFHKTKCTEHEHDNNSTGMVASQIQIDNVKAVESYFPNDFAMDVGLTAHDLIKDNSNDVVASQIQNDNVKLIESYSPNENFAMDVDLTPAKNTTNVKFAESPLDELHNVHTDKKRSIRSGLQLISTDKHSGGYVSAINNDHTNNMDLKLPADSQLKEAAFAGNTKAECMQNSLQKITENNHPSEKLENLQVLNESKHFNTSMFYKGGGPSKNISMQPIPSDISYAEAREANSKANITSHTICSEAKTPGSSFHTTFDDTQHLINYSLSNKQPKSDFSKIITGDLNPTFLNSKFMHLSDFSSCAFPISLDNTRNNQTHLDCTETDKDKSCRGYSATKPQQTTYVINKTSTLHSDTFPTLSANDQARLDNVETNEDLSCNDFNRNKPQQTTYLINNTNDNISTLQSDAFMRAFGNTSIGQEFDKDNDKINTQAKSEVVNTYKRRSSENIENVVECKKMLLDNPENRNLINETVEMETSFNGPGSVGNSIQCSRAEAFNISQENITLSNSIDDSFLPISLAAQEVIGNITRSYNTSSMDATDSANEVIENHISSRSKALWETYMKNNNSVRNMIQEFIVKTTNQLTTKNKNSTVFEEKCNEAMKKLRLPFKQLSLEELQGSMGSSTDCSFSEPTMNDMEPEERPLFKTDTNLNMEFEKVLTLKEKVEEKCKKSKRCWSIFIMEENKYEFHTLFKTIRLVVYLDKETGIVNKSDVYSHISGDSEATALFVHKILKERLSQKNIQSAVGDKYDILTLLDYVYMNMQKILDFLKEVDHFAKGLNLKMDQNFRVTFKVINLSLRNTWCISVDMSDIDNITENSVSAWAKVGTVKEMEIKNIVKNCPRGLLFLKFFIDKVFVYTDMLKKRKMPPKMKVGNMG